MSLLARLLLVLTFVHCSARPEMRKIETLWRQVVSSQTIQEESRAVDELRLYMEKNRISIKTVVTDTQGRKIDYMDAPADLQIVAVHIQFFMENNVIEGVPWEPKDIAHLYRLYQE
ncbi:hypothetical protein [Cystobacter ferrugineus]|uniref:hypothetical protein n=1 Tax=Cystobacter ferrugineus TaxID=83449 RepID=UPI0009045AD8|nr:hypothetical protein [Cystobacter ferrugineus]